MSKSATPKSSAPAAKAPLAHGWLAWLLPVVSGVSMTNLNDPATLPRTLLWSVALLFWMGVIWAARKRRKVEAHGLPKLLLAAMATLMAAHLLSFAAAISAMEALLSTLRVGLLLVSVWLVWEHQRRGGDRSAKVWLLSAWATGLLQSVIVLFQLLSHADEVPQGTQYNSNLVGSLIALTLPAAVWLCLQTTKALRWVVVASLPLLLAAIYVSESRAALLMLLVYAVIGTGVALAQLRKGQLAARLRWMLLGGTGAAVLATFALLYMGWGRKEMPRSYQSLTDPASTVTPDKSSIEVRMVLWNKSVQMALAHPLTGVGAGNWKLNAPAYGLKGYDAQGRYGMVFYVRPHNDWLWMFAETGFLGLLGILAFFALLVAHAVRRGGATNSYGWVALLGIAGYLTDAFFSFPIERIENTILLSAYAGLALTGVASKPGRTLLGLGGAASVLLPTLVLSLLRLPSDEATLAMRRAQTQHNYPKMQKAAEEADKPWCRYEAQTATPFGWHMAMSKVEQARPLGAGMAASPLMAEALGDLLLARELAPHNFLVLSELGSTYSQMGRHAEAARAYGDLVSTFPDNEEGWVNLAICHFNLQQYEEVRKALAHVSEGNPNPNVAAMRQALAGLPTP